MSDARPATRLAVVGASGRMGQAIVRIARETAGIDVVCEVSEGDDLSAVAKNGAHVAIDFSSPAGTLALAQVAKSTKVALVVGTTGLDDACLRALDEASRVAAVFVAANMSVGVHVLGEAVALAMRMLGEEFDVEIVEAHHRKKVDAPSGTALRLAEVAKSVRGEVPYAHGRQGRPGARPTREIGMHAIRGGDVIGDHTVHLLGDGERLELTHRASNRDLFARGAVRAARWVAGKGPGRYGMADMLAREA